MSCLAVECGSLLRAKTSTEEKELAVIEKCIIRTMRKFREQPRFFWSEDDICCYLKGLLLKGRLFKSGRVGNVFLRFPTKDTYEHHENGTLFTSPGGKRDHFALAGWTSAVPTTWNHVTQQLSFAIVLKHFSTFPKDWAVQIKNEILKLSDDVNGVPIRGRYFLLLTAQQTSLFREQLNSLFAEYPSVRCYQQIAQ